MGVAECGRGLFDEIMERKVCGPGLGCLPGFWDQLTIKLDGCKIDFWKICDVDTLIRICPFDPAWDAFDWKQQGISERLQALEVHVKELEARLPTHK